MSDGSEVEALVRQLDLEPLLPEGGFFRRTYYADATEAVESKAPGRPLSAILYLMHGDGLRFQCYLSHLSFQVTMYPSFIGLVDSGSFSATQA